MLSSIIEYPDLLTKEVSTFIARIPAAQLVWKVGGAAWLAMLLFICVGKSNSSYKRLGVFILIALGLIGFRLPNLVLPMLSFDESDWAVCAATLFKRPIFWRDVDATTSGPFNIYPLMSIRAFGLSLNYFTLRLFGLLMCVLPTYFLIDRLLSKRYSWSLPLPVAFPLLVGLTFLNEEDMVAFNSTHIPMVMFALCYTLLLYPSTKVSFEKVFYPLLFLLGSFPFMKLQTIPPAVALGLWTCFKGYFEWGIKTKVLVRGLFVSVLPSVLIIAFISYFGIQKDFWESYIVNNVLYTKYGVAGQEKDWWYKVRVPLFLIADSPSIRFFFCSVFGIGLVSLCNNLIYFKRIDLRFRSGIFWTTLTLIATYYCVSVTGNLIHYYLLLLVVPLSMWSFTNFTMMVQLQHVWYQRALLIFYTVVAVCLPAGAAILEGSMGVSQITKGYRGQVDGTISDVIRLHAKAGESIAVLGYRPDIYIQTETILGIRAAATYRFCIPFDKQQQAYYEKTYVKDIKRNKPVVFVDATANSAPSYAFDSEKHRYENYPLLKKVIETEYRYIGTYDRVRIFSLIQD